MSERTIRECDHCGKDLMQFDASRGALDGQRYIRLQETRRELRTMTSTSIDRPMLFGVYCGTDCLEAALYALRKGP
jgi:hypothetical protein